MGVVGGTAAGGIQANSTALPKEKAEALEKVMSTVLEDASFSIAMSTRFAETNGDRWILTNDPNSVNVTLGLEALTLTQLEDDVVAVNLTASMIIAYGPDAGQTTRRFLFSNMSQGRPVDDYLEGDDEFFREQLTTVLQLSVDEIIAALDHSGAQRAAR